MIASFFIVSIALSPGNITDDCMEKKYKDWILFHEACKFIPSVVIICCICEPSCSLKKILKSKIDDTSSFKLEMSKIHLMNLTIICSIAFQCFAYILVIWWVVDDAYSRIHWLYRDMSFITKILPSLLPIMIVLINHFTSLHSFAHIFKILVQKDHESSETSMNQCTTVYLSAVTEENEFPTLKSSREKSSQNSENV